MGTQTTDVVLRQFEDRASIADMVAIACQLFGHEEIGSIQVVLKRRPTYDELARFRRWADARGLEITATASGVVIRRRWSEGRATSTESGEPHDLSGVINRVRPPLDWLRIHGRSWCAEFGGMSEGTR
jgi:hypothetical protein